ncbi:hypothetical protein A2U01_0079027, partial [Trifolium medium]|nr:hypothetical protein [Trifolium medium]
MMESVNVVIDDSDEEKGTDAPASSTASDQHDNMLETEKEDEDDSENSNSEINAVQPKKGPSIKVQKNHPQELII